MHWNSPVFLSSNNWINTIKRETYADSIPLILWLPSLVSHLWRLGRLGSQGWIFLGFRILGGNGRQCDPMMFLECLLPPEGALNL